MTTPLLELRDVHAAYLMKDVLRGVSLAVSFGEIVALVGENGSGKSTVLSVVAGLLRPTRGAVLFEGREIAKLPAYQRQRVGIGYMLQGGRVFPSLTVEENLQLAAERAGRADRKEGPGVWFPSLRERLRDRAGLLSGGQRQMLAVELVIAQRPKLLLLDEPTASLSADLAEMVLERIADYVRNGASGALLVEHTATAAAVATRTLDLIHGVIAAGQKEPIQ